jgi:SAM-dependent methyltransferase
MTTAAEAWRKQVEDHHAQTAKARGDRPEAPDMWSTLASNFKADPKRTDDPVVNFLLQFIGRENTVLDVGGGAGRYALPLALHCKHVTVVEPSPSMTSALAAASREAGISNVSAVESKWEHANVGPADLVLAANVVYGVTEIVPFVQRLNEHAREVVVIVAYMDSPSSMMSPLWKAVHGDERIDLPGAPELLPVLWEAGIFPNVQMIAPERAGSRAALSMDAAIQIARVFLQIEPGTEADERLVAEAPKHAIETPNGVTLRRPQVRPQAVIWWRPGEFGG